MNSLNTDTVASMNQTKYRPIDVSNPYYQPNLFYQIRNNANITPEFASLQNAYGANQLLATQFSFQYSDNQGLGEGLAGGNHSGAWTGNGSQPRNNPPIDTSHFYSLPSHGHAQTGDQNLFYPYGYSATNNVYWQHPPVVEYKSNTTTTSNNNNANQNYNYPVTDKSQNWPETMVSNQYSPLNNTLNFKSNISPIENQLLSINSTQSNYELQLGSNGYQIAQVAVKMPVEDMHSLHDDRSSNRKSDTCNNVETTYSSVNNPTIDINLDMDSLQSHMVQNCSLTADNNNSCPSQHPYSVQSLSKLNLSHNNNATTDFWASDASKLSNFNVTKSYAKAAKLPSRSVTHLPNSSSSAYYIENGYNGNVPRSNVFKSTTNGFATGFVRPSGGSNNNNNNNWFNNTSNGQNWNTTKSKWNLEGNRNNLSQAASDSLSKSTWASKLTLSSTDEHLRNVEFKIKEILQQINPKRLDINFEKTRYFVIKSYSEDDVHRSIKYKIWCSTKEGNRRLNEAFMGAQKIGGHILLFFSVNGSGHFCGVAEMISVVDENVITGVWCQDKWRGKFSVKWLYVKDVPNTQLRHISTKVKIPKGNGESVTEVKPITNLRDATELKSDRGSGSSYKDDIGYQALKIIMDCKSTMSIFDDFLHYEKRELGIENSN